GEVSPKGLTAPSDEAREHRAAEGKEKSPGARCAGWLVQEAVQFGGRGERGEWDEHAELPGPFTRCEHHGDDTQHQAQRRQIEVGVTTAVCSSQEQRDRHECEENGCSSGDRSVRSSGENKRVTIKLVVPGVMVVEVGREDMPTVSEQRQVGVCEDQQDEQRARYESHRAERAPPLPAPFPGPPVKGGYRHRKRRDCTQALRVDTHCCRRCECRHREVAQTLGLVEAAYREDHERDEYCDERFGPQRPEP